eukprot:SAG31_NODE_13442_length_869_cov_0.932468_1_plen_82_part_01
MLTNFLTFTSKKLPLRYGVRSSSSSSSSIGFIKNGTVYVLHLIYWYHYHFRIHDARTFSDNNTGKVPRRKRNFKIKHYIVSL